MAHDDFEVEPVPGLPRRLPEGEALLWQGSPSASRVLRHVFRVQWVAVYFAILSLWKLEQSLSRGVPVADSIVEAAVLLVLGAVAVGLLVAIGIAIARTTIYSITSKRVILRFGVALPMTIAIPFTKIAGADMKRHADGSGDVSLRIAEGQRVSYLIAWPHVRPWRFLSPRPSFRALADPTVPAGVLARAVEQAAPGEILRGHVAPARPARGVSDPAPAAG